MSIIYLIIIFLFSRQSLATINTNNSLHPDVGLNIYEFIDKYGYTLETHWVQTEDGYILGLHRIPHGINSTNNNRSAVLLMHGLLSSSMDWVNIGPQKALSFLLADAGYDVWLGNQRGNTWSRNHTVLDPDTNSSSFFDFSFHEIGCYDLPATIDYILDRTGQEQIYYVGHSQGTTAFFVMTSERPEYNSKIKLMSALAPVAYIPNTKSPIVQFVAKYSFLFKLSANTLKMYEFLPHFKMITELGKVLCRDGSILQNFCADFLSVLSGFDSPQLNKSFIPVITSNTPAGASVKQIYHYLQELNSGKFRQYDYGIFGNWRHYGSFAPPNYNLKNVTAPVVLHYAENDWLSAVDDVEKLAQELPNLVKNQMVPYALFTHLDFLWANDIVQLINNDVLKEIENH